MHKWGNSDKPHSMPYNGSMLSAWHLGHKNYWQPNSEWKLEKLKKKIFENKFAWIFRIFFFIIIICKKNFEYVNAYMIQTIQKRYEINFHSNCQVFPLVYDKIVCSHDFCDCLKSLWPFITVLWSVCWSVGLFVCRSGCHNLLKDREVILQCTYRNACLCLIFVTAVYSSQGCSAGRAARRDKWAGPETRGRALGHHRWYL